ncbi:hypothetical protein VBL11_01995 [Enterobacter cloacae]|uniref:hypothetical protein n=1 Tax=Enterobacter cloacae TaxID=550 RepID=UPI001F18DAE2|nr:hypothetical protein [Enterobacter cloacae]MEA3723466.1 hypothetical protein [Enterobacter cloacae]MEA3727000.1 hypothetical protein [Enterobacter cloacae]MEA3737677.1 hypothetical protein [Enterobacter cloacae]MEA3751963.1 hypothetical protein [Enterobacter cloacae]MEA3766803.1 hypothetical protein [Enterobacter cloacae]
MSNIDKHAVQAVADLKAGYTLGHADVAILNELARIALASLEAEPVDISDDMAYAFHHALSDSSLGADDVDEIKTGLRAVFANITAPPAPVSVPDAMEMDDDFDSAFEHGKAVGWNACRAAMLQGAEPVTTAYKLPVGWVAVPVEPTEDMIVNGFESEPDESFSDEKEWEAYDAMSGCQQAAHRAKLCWAAMIAAAPKLE